MIFRKKNANTTLTSQIRISRCASCGAILQDEDPKKNGYISKKRIDEHIEEMTCDRCYNLRHYNAVTNEFSSDYQKLLLKAKADDALVVYVLDLFALEASLIPNIAKYLPNKLLVVLNKRDILPEETDDNKLVSDIKKRLNLDHVNPDKIMILSSIKDLNTSELFASVDELRKGKDVYFIGASLVGKSSLVTQLLRQYVNKTSRVISTKNIEGSSLSVMEIPLDQDSSIYDTPGIYNPLSMVNVLERDVMRTIVPHRQIKPKDFTLSEGDGIIFGGIAAMDIAIGEANSYRFILSERVSLTQVKSRQIEASFDSLIAQKQVQPISAYIRGFDNLVCRSVKLPPSGKAVISIYGFMRVDFDAHSQQIELYLPKGVGSKLIIS